MSNIEKVAECIYAHRQSVGDFPDGLTAWEELPETWREEWREAAYALADAGLIAPESEQTEFDHNSQDYLTREIYVSKGLVHFRFGYTGCEEIEPDCLPPELAREFAGRLIAAANYAEEKNQ